MAAKSGRLLPTPANRMRPDRGPGVRASVRGIPTDALEAPLHKRSLRLLSGLVALGLLTAACGNDDDTSTDETTTTAAGDDTTTTEGDGDDASQVSLDDLCEEAKADGSRPLTASPSASSPTSARSTTGTFNQYAYEGMDAAEECFGFETTSSRRPPRPTTPRTSPPPSRATRT